jgi:hypothetical protein
MNRFSIYVMAGALAAVALRSAAVEPSPPRANPPEFSPETFEAFFTDAREHLVGERPTRPAAPGQSPTTATAAGAATDGAPAANFSWSKLVSGEALATEIKRLAAAVRDPLSTAARFKGDGHRQCQAAFSQLAVLFAIVAQYDGDVRWRDAAPALRDRMARAAASCQAGSDSSFAEAQARAAELDEIVRGGRLDAEKPSAFDNQWNTLAERTQLMQRMQLAYRDRVRPQLADAKLFARHAAEVRHEAQVLALLAEIIRRPAYEGWDDDAFGEYAGQLRGAAQDLSRAAEAQDYSAARSALSRAGEACTACHDGYRL